MSDTLQAMGLSIGGQPLNLTALLNSFGLTSGYVENFVNGTTVEYYKSKYGKETYYTGEQNDREPLRMHKQNSRETSVDYNWAEDYSFDQMIQTENVGID